MEREDVRKPCQKASYRPGLTPGLHMWGSEPKRRPKTLKLNYGVDCCPDPRLTTG